MLGYILTKLFPPKARRYTIEGIPVHVCQTRRQVGTNYGWETPPCSILIVKETSQFRCRGLSCSICPAFGKGSCYDNIINILSRPVYTRRRR